MFAGISGLDIVLSMKLSCYIILTSIGHVAVDWKHVSTTCVRSENCQCKGLIEGLNGVIRQPSLKGQKNNRQPSKMGNFNRQLNQALSAVIRVVLSAVSYQGLL